MQVENDANAANVAELQAHISLAAARANTLAPGTRAAEENITDLQDYYERMVQIRKMTIDTLQETLGEVHSRHRKQLRRWKLVAGAGALAVLALAPICAPDAVDTAVGWMATYATVDRCITHAVLICIFLLSRSSYFSDK